MGNPKQGLQGRGPLCGVSRPGLGANDGRAAAPQGTDQGRSGFIKDQAQAEVEVLGRAITSSQFTTGVIDVSDLLRIARKKSAMVIDGTCAGPRHHNAVVDTLFELERLLGDRLSSAKLDKRYLPVVKGIKWQPDDPLAGIAKAVDPFSMSILWTKRVVPKVTVPAPRRRRRRKKYNTGNQNKKRVRAAKYPTPRITKIPDQSFKHMSQFTKFLKTAGIELFKDLLSNISLRLSMLLVGLTAYEYLTKWIYARQSGLKIAERRVALKVFADGLASMAMKIGPPNLTKRPPCANNFCPPVLPWLGVAIPAPDAKGVTEDLKNIQAGRVHSSAKEVQSVIKNGRIRGLKMAADYVNNLNRKRSGDGYKFLWGLKVKYKNRRQDIYGYLITEIRRELNLTYLELR